MIPEWMFILSLFLTAVGFFAAGRLWELEYGYWRKKFYELTGDAAPRESSKEG